MSQLKLPKIDGSRSQLDISLEQSRLNLTNGNPIDIFPQEIFFHEIKEKTTYEIVVQIKNTTKKPRKIRVFQPKIQQFRCDYDIQGPIAAGLSLKLVVSFSTSKIEDYHDHIRIVSDDNFQYDLPIHALKPQSQIIFEPMINFGFVECGVLQEQKIVFKNEGQEDGIVQLQFKKAYVEVSIEEQQFILKPGQVKNIMMKFQSEETGIFKGQIEVIVNSFYNVLKTIDINATSVEHLIYLIDNQGQKLGFFFQFKDNLNFNQMYMGTCGKIQAYLVNNSPKAFDFKCKIRQGSKNDNKNEHLLITPYELGQEQSQSLIRCEPMEGNVESYSQISLQFKCETQIKEKHYEQIRAYSTNNQKYSDIMQENYQYTAIFNYDDNSFMVNLSGTGIIPTFKMSQRIFNFGECPTNQRKDLKFQIQNQNPNLPIDFDFFKQGYFSIYPKSLYLKPQEKYELFASFYPKALGKTAVQLKMKYLKTNQFDILLEGSSNSIKEKNLSLQTQILNVIDQSEIEIYSKKNKSTTHNNSKQINISRNLQDYQTQENSFQFEQFISQMSNRNKYDNYLREQIQIKKQKQEKAQTERQSRVIQYNMARQNSIVDKKDEDQKAELTASQKKFIKHQPRDNNDLMLAKCVKEPLYRIQKNNESLFLSQFSNYDKANSNQQYQFNPNPLQPVKKKLINEPKTHQDIRDCQSVLNGLELQKIQTGPSILNFGTMYVKAKSTQTFWIRNDNLKAIHVQLKIENPELQESYQQPQIIQCGQVAGFEVTLMSNTLQIFKTHVKYVINQKHEFLFEVQGIIEPVKLSLNKQKIKFQFADDNLEMETSDVIRITNNGNSTANFKWLASNTDTKLFKIKPTEGQVEANSQLKCEVIYQPNSTSGCGKIDEDRLILRIQDGGDLSLQLQGIVNEVKCQFTNDILDLGQISVMKKVDSQFWVKNQSRNSSVLHVISFPPGIEIIPLKTKILPDETKQFKMFLKYEQEGQIESKITIKPRGQNTISIPIKFEAKLPDVSILEQKFDFGQLTVHGIAGEQIMTLQNKSNVPACLLMDLRRNDYTHGVECLEIQLVENKKDKSNLIRRDNILEQIEDNPNPNLIKDNFQDSLSNNSESDNENDQQEEKINTRNYKINMSANSTQQLLLKFVAQDISQYQFQLPIQILGAGTIESIERNVHAIGIQPRFFLQPQFIEFKRKTITNMDQRIPNYQSFILSNPNKQPLQWFIDTTDFQEDQIFNVNPNKGVLNENQEIHISASFNPYKSGDFEQFANLYLDGDNKKSHMKIKFKGEGIFPKITFDRREVILPTVPLNIVSKCTFKIFNEGYDNFNLKPIISQEMGVINIKLNYPDGKNLNISRKKIRLEVTYKNDKPQSFTTKIEFIDENQRCYSIPVSGTTDNCILTNFSYLQRAQTEYKIQAEPEQQIQLIEQLLEDDQSSNKDYDKTLSQGTKSFASTANQSLGYTPIPQSCMIKNIKCCQIWMNHFAFSFQIKNFPNDVIEQNGSQIFELLQYFLGKLPAFKHKIVENFNQQNVQQNQNLHQRLILQYDELILYMKENGAFLNSIRPQYLLSYQDFLNFQKSDTHKDIINQSSSKISESKFNYIQNDSWVQLVFQLLKIFYLSRVTLKSIKTNYSNFNIPEIYLTPSNLYSEQEMIIISWLEQFGKGSDQLQRIVNLDSDLKNGLVFANILKTYVQSQRLEQLLQLRQRCLTDEDCRNNQNKIISALAEIGTQCPLSLEELVNPMPKDILLFCLHLFFTLPHYQPVKDPILFQTILGDTCSKIIELENNTNKLVIYHIKYEGSSDFNVDDQQPIKIEPKSCFKYKVTFTSRLSQSQYGRIWFTSQKDGNNQVAAALVFDLQSKISGRKSAQIWQTSSKLYQLEECKLQIQNNFFKSNQDIVEFQVELIQEHQKVSKQEDNGKEKKNKKKQIQAQTEEQEDRTYIAPFFITKKSIKIRKGDTNTFVVQFLPFEKQQCSCKLIFFEPTVGEFQHEIIGEVQDPDVISEFKLNQIIYVDQKFSQEFLFPTRNEQLFNAIKIHEQRVNQYNRQKEKEELINKKAEIQQMNNFQIQVNPRSSYIQCPEYFQTTVIKRMPSLIRQEEDKRSNAENQDSTNKYPISIHFKTPVNQMMIHFVFTSEDKLDIRIYKMNLNISPLPIKAQIEMIAQIGEVVLQEIPIVNYSQKDWQIKVQLINENAKQTNNCFTGPVKDFSVKKNTNGMYPITYTPTSLSESNSKLILQNPHTNDVFEYSLKGMVKEPIALEHIIIKCEAKEKVVKKIVINNNGYKNIRYKVETDLDNVSGLQSFDVQSYSNYNYDFVIQPILGGIYTGQITFQDRDDPNKYIWYTVCINVERTKAVEIVELSSHIRQTIEFQIQLSNPTDKPSNYDINIDGNYVTGSESFFLDANSSGKYSLFFSPLKEEQTEGSISIFNKNFGEIWYELKLIGLKAQSQTLSTFKAELGKSVSQQVELFNPSDFNVEGRVQLQNQVNYEISQTRIHIPARDKAYLNIKYTPTSIRQNENGEVQITTNQIGDWKFYLNGVGDLPTSYDETIIYSQINEEQNFQLKFRNPLRETLKVQIDLENNDENVFELKLNNQKNEIHQNSTLIIPLAFNPLEISQFKSEIVIIAQDKHITWKFPLKGISQYINSHDHFKYKTKARNQIEENLEFILEGLNSENLKNEEFNIQVDEIPQEYQNIIHQSLSFQIIKNVIKNPTDKLIFNMKFLPYKPANIQCKILITRKSGGVWRYNMHLVSTDPDYDDKIQIQCKINESSIVQFQIENQFKESNEFKAYFTYDSDPVFLVAPEAGFFQGDFNEQTFQLQYSPVEFGQYNKGNLIIETKDYLWRFLVQGIFPQYNPPEVNKSFIPNNLSIIQPLKFIFIIYREKKNYLQQNIKATRHKNY